MKTMLIITGPQGSGNHLFSKVFALHDEVYGWKTLLETYWEGHHQEPFSDMWHNPELAHEFDWEQSDYYVTSISCPFFRNGTPQIPKYNEFINAVSSYVEVKIIVIGRDSNILQYQQQRVRGKPTTSIFIDNISLIFEDIYCFISQELLYLYRNKYLEHLHKQLEFPIAYSDGRIDIILNENSNKKYITPIDNFWLDHEAQQASRDS